MDFTVNQGSIWFISLRKKYLHFRPNVMNCFTLIEILRTILASLVSEKTPSISTLTTMKHHTLLALILGFSSAIPVNAKWQRIATPADRPVPVGGKGLLSEATILSSIGIGKADHLLSNDPADSVTIPVGASQAVITFKNPTVLNRSSFVSDGIEGRAILTGSIDQKNWAALDEKIFSASDREVNFTFAGMQMKFLKLEFIVSKAGGVRAFVMYGNESDKDYTVKQTVGDPSKAYPVNFSGVGGTRIVFASPRPENGLDEAAQYNKFSFPESDERYRTLIYDLGQLRVLNSFGSVHSPRPVRFEVFTFQKLPQKEDWKGRLLFDPADFGEKEPVASGEDTRGLGYLKIKPGKPVGARYVALRWEPDFNPPTFGVSAPAVSGPSQGPASMFTSAGVPPGSGSGGTQSTPGAGGTGSGAPPGGGADGAGGSAPAGTTASTGGISDGNGGSSSAGGGGGGQGGSGGQDGGGGGGQGGGGVMQGGGGVLNGSATGGIIGAGGGNSPP